MKITTIRYNCNAKSIKILDETCMQRGVCCSHAVMLRDPRHRKREKVVGAN